MKTKHAISGLVCALALGAGAYYFKDRVNICVAHQWDGADTFHCTRSSPRTVSPETVANNHNLHQWACDTVLASIERDSETIGCYDICDRIAVKVKVEGPTFYGPDLSSRLIYTNLGTGTKHFEAVPAVQPLFVGDEYSQDIINACAVVLHGAEW